MSKVFCVGKFENKKDVGVRYEAVINLVASIIKEPVTPAELLDKENYLYARVLDKIKTLDDAYEGFKVELQGEVEESAPRPPEQSEVSKDTPHVEATEKKEVDVVPPEPPVEPDSEDVSLDELGDYKDENEGLDFF